MISAIHKFRENILESSWNISETTPRPQWARLIFIWWKELCCIATIVMYRNWRCVIFWNHFCCLWRSSLMSQFLLYKISLDVCTEVYNLLKLLVGGRNAVKCHYNSVKDCVTQVKLSNTDRERFIIKYRNSISSRSLLSQMVNLIMFHTCCSKKFNSFVDCKIIFSSHLYHGYCYNLMTPAQQLTGCYGHSNVCSIVMS